MSAKKPKAPIVRALGAFISKRITKEEYDDCLNGRAYVSGTYLHTRRPDPWRKGRARYTVTHLHKLRAAGLARMGRV